MLPPLADTAAYERVEPGYGDRPSSRALFEIASGGYYPSNTDPGGAFAVNAHPVDATRCLLSVSIVFGDQRSAEAFVVKADSYVAKTHGVDYYQPFTITTAERYFTPRLVLESDCIPNQADGDAPHDLPGWNVEVSDMDLSALSPKQPFSREPIPCSNTNELKETQRSHGL